jgi:hypothetical protein
MLGSSGSVPSLRARVVGGKRQLPQAVSDPKPAKKLHAATVGDVHLRMAGGRRIAPDQQRIHAVVLEFEGQGQPYRPGAGNEDGNVFNRIDCHGGHLQPWSL